MGALQKEKNQNGNASEHVCENQKVGEERDFNGIYGEYLAKILHF